MVKVLSIGKATQDVFLQGKIFTPHCDKTTCYAHLELGAKLSVEEVIFSTGGNAMNAAVTLARNGLEVDFISQVSDDPAGQFVLKTLDKENIGAHEVKVAEGARTSYSTILLSPSGERTILNYQGSDLDTSIYKLSSSKVDWLYLSSVNSFEHLIKLLADSVEAGTKVAFNPGGTDLSRPKDLVSHLSDLYIFVANKEEYQLIFDDKNATPIELLAKARQVGVNIALLTDGPNGAWASDGEKVVKAGMYDDVPVVDRTGAGDSFASGFVASLISGRTIEQSIIFASANSTSVVQKIGATGGILSSFEELHDMPLEVTNL